MSRFVRVTRGAPGRYNANGLELLRCALWDGGREVAHVVVISGIAGRQNFRTLANEVRGAFEPIPEGRYRNVGSPEWHGRVGDHSDKWSEALGAVVIEVYGEREIMLHIDGNVPGSAGCLCPLALLDLDAILAWWAAGKPEWVECDWGLGTVSAPQVAGDKLHRVKLYAKPGKCVAFRDGLSQDALTARLDYHDGKLGLAINGSQLPMDQIQTVSIEVAYKAGK